MKQIQPSLNEHQWPRQTVKSIEVRKLDLVFRIADWGRDHEEPAFDVEVYIGGVYDWNQSQTFTFSKFQIRKAQRLLLYRSCGRR